MPIPIEHRPVTTQDFRAVFKVLAGIDGHQRSVDDAETWMIAARAGRWTRAQVAAATLALTSKFTGFRVQPGHMTEQINRNRDRVKGHWYCPDPPRELAEDPAAEIAWRRWAANDYADRALMALANGDPIDEVPLTLDREPSRQVLEDGKRRLRESIDRFGREHQVETPPVPAPGRKRDPEQMAAARREIAAARPGDIPAQQTAEPVREEESA